MATSNGMMISPEESSSAAPDTSGPDYQTGRSYFENTYARLPERFYARLNPRPVAAPRLIKLNMDLARTLGLDPDALASPEGVEILVGNRLAAGSE
jgi:serine/tyrosine/threonine adenylyltransferase